MSARLWQLAQETAVREEVLREIEVLLGREVETRHVYAAEGFAVAMGITLADAVDLLRDSPEQLEFLFGLDAASLTFERANAELTNPYDALLDAHPEVVAKLKGGSK